MKIKTLILATIAALTLAIPMSAGIKVHQSSPNFIAGIEFFDAVGLKILSGSQEFDDINDREEVRDFLFLEGLKHLPPLSGPVSAITEVIFDVRLGKLGWMQHTGKMNGRDIEAQFETLKKSQSKFEKISEPLPERPVHKWNAREIGLEL